jgi:HK97 family phage portal protein
MRWFGFKSGRDGARPALSRGAGGLLPGASGRWPHGYDGQVREAYLANPIAQRAVKLVAEGVASAPLSASDPALAALIAARSNGQALTEVIATQLLLHGNAYVQILTDDAGGAVELFALRPERVSVEPDAGGWPAVYRYRVGERVTRLSADGPRPQIVHIRTFHPLDDHYGLGCLGAAAGAVAVHNAAAKWNVALLDNAARPSGALVYDPGDGSALSRDQFERLRGELEASFSGSGNAGRPMLLEGGLKWQSLSLSPAEMDFANTRAAAAREIAMAFGVPPMLLGLPGDATYANYKEANRALWRLAILPVAATIFAGLGQALSGWFEGAKIAVDLNQVTALSEDRERLWAQVTAADFLTPAEKRAMLGLDHLETPA